MSCLILTMHCELLYIKFLEIIWKFHHYNYPIKEKNILFDLSMFGIENYFSFVCIFGLCILLENNKIIKKIQIRKWDLSFFMSNFAAPLFCAWLLWSRIKWILRFKWMKWHKRIYHHLQKIYGMQGQYHNYKINKSTNIQSKKRQEMKTYL